MKLTSEEKEYLLQILNDKIGEHDYLGDFDDLKIAKVLVSKVELTESE